MTWEEWERLKTDAEARRSTQMQINHVAPVGGGGGATPTFGDLRVKNADLEKIGKGAHSLFEQLGREGKVAHSTSDSAASDLKQQGFDLAAGLQHVSSRWEKQLGSLLDACAQISNHLHRTQSIHGGDEDYIRRTMSSIDTLDQGFDERVGKAGKPNPAYYGKPSEKKDD
ncbi:hypothetical protein [Streptomyces sp. NPDC058142]|uniref:hypothetical protein n=1 Tax=Streptomyces sp. NPDC058142 TaxID=3346355 RepID=UPI0036EDE52E